MPISLRVLLLLLLIFLLFLGGLWIVIPIIYGLPSIPTKRNRIRKALQLAEVKLGETVYDLGAGDGQVLIIAAREFGARPVGIEIEPLHCLLIWLKALFGGLHSRVRVCWGNFYRANLSNADVVFVYLTSSQIKRLGPQLEQQLPHGARLVSVSADFPSWQPKAVDIEQLIFLYRMPPTPSNSETFLV